MAYAALRTLLFGLDPERAHDLATWAMARGQRLAGVRRRVARRLGTRDPRLAVEILGLDFPSPVMMAAGFDKNARLVPMLTALGFGGIEVGTVTPRPQPGNPRPRLWRHRERLSLQNCLGFNGDGMEVVATNLGALAERTVPIGINLGKNKDTPLAAAADDYLRLVEHFATLGDYFVLNLSSPNTPQLRDLQVPDFVVRVLAAAAQLTSAPVLVKIAPDMTDRAAVELATSAVSAGAAGIIATNTTTAYERIPGAREVGGLSGAVLRERSFELLETLAAALGDAAVLISVGGVDSAAEAYRRLRAGASLVQLYTAMVYEGPGLVARINRELVELLERDGLARLTEAIGLDR